MTANMIHPKIRGYSIIEDIRFLPSYPDGMDVDISINLENLRCYREGRYIFDNLDRNIEDPSDLAALSVIILQELFESHYLDYIFHTHLYYPYITRISHDYNANKFKFELSLNLINVDSMDLSHTELRSNFHKFYNFYHTDLIHKWDEVLENSDILGLIYNIVDSLGLHNYVDEYYWTALKSNDDESNLKKEYDNRTDFVSKKMVNELTDNIRSYLSDKFTITTECSVPDFEIIKDNIKSGKYDDIISSCNLLLPFTLSVNIVLSSLYSYEKRITYEDIVNLSKSISSLSNLLNILSQCIIDEVKLGVENLFYNELFINEEEGD